MQNKKINIHSFIPHISNRALLFVAFLVWTFAGGMLIYRGIIGIVEFPAFIVIKLIVALLLGTAFYWFMFTNRFLPGKKKVFGNLGRGIKKN